MSRLAWIPGSPAALPVFEEEIDVVLAKVREEALALTRAKGVVYQDAAGVDSCFRSGFPGLYHNLRRKWDRIDTVGKRLGLTGLDPVLAVEAALDAAAPETLYVTVRDLVVYGVHTMRWLRGEQRRG